jgi:hypothetical protein
MRMDQGALMYSGSTVGQTRELRASHGDVPEDSSSRASPTPAFPAVGFCTVENSTSDPELSIRKSFRRITIFVLGSAFIVTTAGLVTITTMETQSRTRLVEAERHGSWA